MDIPEDDGFEEDDEPGVPSFIPRPPEPRGTMTYAREIPVSQQLNDVCLTVPDGSADPFKFFDDNLSRQRKLLKSSCALCDVVGRQGFNAKGTNRLVEVIDDMWETNVNQSLERAAYVVKRWWDEQIVQNGGAEEWPLRNILEHYRPPRHIRSSKGTLADLERKQEEYVHFLHNVVVRRTPQGAVAPNIRISGELVRHTKLLLELRKAARE